MDLGPGPGNGPESWTWVLALNLTLFRFSIILVQDQVSDVLQSVPPKGEVQGSRGEVFEGGITVPRDV